jgi:hypothetical protein
MNAHIGARWKRAHSWLRGIPLLRCNAGTTKLSQSELFCLRANCVATTHFNFIIAARGAGVPRASHALGM